jgi:anthranilate synthase component 1
VNIFGNIKLKEPKTIKLDLQSPFKLFKNVYQHNSQAFLLESMESDSGLSRFSVLGFKPVAILKAHNHVLKIEQESGNEEYEVENPFEEIKKIINHSNEKRGFRGGLVGYVSYEAVKYLEPVPVQESPYPDFEFGLFLDAIIFDKIKKQCQYVTLHQDNSEYIKKIAEEEHYIDEIKIQDIKHHFSKKQYEELVLKSKKRIKSGEIFQSVISNSRIFQISGDKLSFYEKLRRINPSPYMYHVKFGEREIIGSSPEMLVRVEKGKVETFPLAGTIKRGQTPDEDLELEKKLLSDEKEKSEHLMLIDLARNDLGKVCEFGSVKVQEYMGIKKFSHVQHIFSRVTGGLKPEKNAVDAFSAVFPAGTLSGAPKIRAMEIINELENSPRGPYGGAVGYFSLNGNSDFAITIRTMVCCDNQAKIQSGAGIVHDSIPENEYLECENKAEALMEALKIKERI